MLMARGAEKQQQLKDQSSAGLSNVVQDTDHSGDKDMEQGPPIQNVSRRATH